MIKTPRARSSFIFLHIICCISERVPPGPDHRDVSAALHLLLRPPGRSPPAQLQSSSCQADRGSEGLLLLQPLALIQEDPQRRSALLQLHQGSLINQREISDCDDSASCRPTFEETVERRRDALWRTRGDRVSLTETGKEMNRFNVEFKIKASIRLSTLDGSTKNPPALSSARLSLLSIHLENPFYQSKTKLFHTQPDYILQCLFI